MPIGLRDPLLPRHALAHKHPRHDILERVKVVDPVVGVRGDEDRREDGGVAAGAVVVRVSGGEGRHELRRLDVAQGGALNGELVVGGGAGRLGQFLRRDEGALA